MRLTTVTGVVVGDVEAVMCEFSPLEDESASSALALELNVT